jgi:hypothetical protein
MGKVRTWQPLLLQTASREQQRAEVGGAMAGAEECAMLGAHDGAEENAPVDEADADAEERAASRRTKADAKQLDAIVDAMAGVVGLVAVAEAEVHTDALPRVVDEAGAVEVDTASKQRRRPRGRRPPPPPCKPR